VCGAGWRAAARPATIPTMHDPAEPAAAPGDEPPVDGDREVHGDIAVLQVLMAEHASLVSARSLAYNEAFTRAGMFLQALGMSFVGLSLLGAALGFSQDVLVIAVIVVAFDVLIGIATFRRVADTGREDLWAMQAMNRIRQGYVRVAPGSTPFLTAGTFDDVPSVMGSYGFEDASTSTPIGDIAYGVSTSLGLVGMVLAVVSGVLASLVALAVGGSMPVAVIAGIVATVVVFALLATWALGAARANQAAVTVRFPAPGAKAGPEG
jgi:hypothetical protein